MEPNTLTKEEIEHFFFINKSGILRWKNSKARRVKNGSVSGSINTQGYRAVNVKGKTFLAHRIIFAYYNNEWPPLIDHKNRDRSDNRLRNLRPSDRQKNGTNSNVSIGKIKYRGVSRCQSKYRAQIQHKNKHYHIGCFDTPEEAHEAYLESREKLNPGVVNSS